MTAFGQGFGGSFGNTGMLRLTCIQSYRSMNTLYCQVFLHVIMETNQILHTHCMAFTLCILYTVFHYQRRLSYLRALSRDATVKSQQWPCFCYVY